MAHKGCDALSLLHAQEESPEQRLITNDAFWDTAFQGGKIMPQRVKIPNSNEHMLGCVAEVDIQAKETLIVGKGFWLEKGCPPPTRANMGLKPRKPFDKSPDRDVWGIDLLQADGSARYYLSVNSPMAMCNDYRGIAPQANASLVRTPLSEFVCLVSWLFFACLGEKSTHMS